MRKIIRKFLKKLGYTISKLNNSEYKDLLMYEANQVFVNNYQEGMRVTSTPDAGTKRIARFYNLLNIYKYVRNLEGRTAECGCWKGLSSYLLCKTELEFTPSYKGENHEIYDSFSGLSAATENDFIVDKEVKALVGGVGGEEGDFSYQLDSVKRNLNEFKKINYYKGWIPSSFDQNRSDSYKFVHVDVDLYVPTLESLKYFYPRLVAGGIILCDDYGSLRWPGAKQAVEEFCASNGGFIELSTGQALIIKR